MSARVLENCDLLLCIADQMDCARSLARMRAVCRLWRIVLDVRPPLRLRHRMVGDFNGSRELVEWWKQWQSFSWNFFIQILLPKDVDFTAAVIKLLQPLRGTNAGIEIRYKNHVIMILVHERWQSSLPLIHKLSSHRFFWYSFDFPNAPLLLLLDRARL